MTEEWKPILDGNYMVSSDGQVKRITPCRGRSNFIMKSKVNHRGYLSLTIKKKRYFNHCLVASAFIGTKPEGHQINHKDGNKLNNHWSNLEYVTPSQNIRHARDSKHWGKLTVAQVEKIRAMAKTGKYEYFYIAHKFGVDRTTVGRIVRGESRVPLSKLRAAREGK